jgi:hypothetical protein
MNSSNSYEYVTVIGNSYIFPISDLLKTLIDFPTKGVNQVQTSVQENGYSVSVIVLIVLYIESLSVRIKFEKNDFSNRSALVFLESLLEETKLIENIKELFVIRDCIAHNHLWHAKFKFDNEQDEMHLLEAKLNSQFGDKKFSEVINLEDRTTKELKLNLFTTRINFQDVQIVLKTLQAFIEYIGKNDFRNLVSFGKVIDKNGKKFQELIEDVIAV